MVIQKQFTLAVYKTIDIGFENNHIMITFEMLGFTNVPFKQVSLGKLNVVDFKMLCGQ